MFNNGSITASATADSVRKSSEMFMEFTHAVFAAQIRKTKARLGEFGMILIVYLHCTVNQNDLLVTVSNVRRIPGGVIPPNKN